MHRSVYCGIVLYILCCVAVSEAAAKVWLLPDYQQKQLFSHRVNTNTQNQTNKPQDLTCHTYGLMSASEVGAGMICEVKRQILHQICYGDCACPPAYNKTSDSCLAEGKIPSGPSCDGKYYTSCVCDTSEYPYTSSSCSHRLGGISCSDDNGIHYTECVDPCANLTDNTSEWGCQSYYSQCPSLCEIGMPDPCEGLVDNTSDYGCEKYYSECPTLCEVGKTCVPNNCSEYTLTSCPTNSICEECIVGCGDDVKHYRQIGCKTGYYKPSLYWCMNKPFC